ncbi:MAG: hypothetical protein M3416_05435 [Acidobacteriota bacterium]|nr:hypothetical protein [Acidobacteriota bacterium]
MSVSITIRKARQLPGVRLVFADVAMDNSYAAGGEPISAAELGLPEILGALHLGGDSDAVGYHAHFDTDNNKLMVARTAGHTPAGSVGGSATVVGGGIGEAIGINPDSNAGALSKAAATNRTIPLATLLGAAPTFTGTAVAAAALAEVANGVDLSAVTFRMMFVG